jgi:flagellar biosynthesis chaperone FliJ
LLNAACRKCPAEAAARHRAASWPGGLIGAAAACRNEGVMATRTRLDRIVQLKERTEDHALENLARAQSSLGRAAARLAGLRQEARSDGRGMAMPADMLVFEEHAHVRALQALRTAERELAGAMRKEQIARAGYVAAFRSAEALRRAQEKKRAEIEDEWERRDRRAEDELATLRFNASAKAQ